MDQLKGNKTREYDTRNNAHAIKDTCFVASAVLFYPPHAENRDYGYVYSEASTVEIRKTFQSCRQWYTAFL